MISGFFFKIWLKLKLNWNFLDHRYLLAIAFISSLYTGCQVFRQVHELYTGKNPLRPRSALLIELDFVGDQVWYSFFSDDSPKKKFPSSLIELISVILCF